MRTARIPAAWSQLCVTYSVEELQIQNLVCLQPLGKLSQVKGRVDAPLLTSTFCRTLGSCTGKWVWQHFVAADSSAVGVTSGNFSTKPLAGSAESFKVAKPWGEFERMITDDNVESLPDFHHRFSTRIC